MALRDLKFVRSIVRASLQCMERALNGYATLALGSFDVGCIAYADRAARARTCGPRVRYHSVLAMLVVRCALRYRFANRCVFIYRVVYICTRSLCAHFNFVVARFDFN